MASGGIIQQIRDVFDLLQWLHAIFVCLCEAPCVPILRREVHKYIKGCAHDPPFYQFASLLVKTSLFVNKSTLLIP